jgi:uncharacterized membrane protein
MALLVAVFPANVQMVVNHDLFPEYSVEALWVRLPLQVVLIGSVYWYTVSMAQEKKSGETGAA